MVEISEGTAEGNIKHIQRILVYIPALSFSGNDYNFTQPVELALGAGVISACTDVTTNDDEVYESNETLVATLSSTNDDVIITISSASILIIDNDGKVFCIW